MELFKNYMEDVVKQFIDQVLKDIKVCNCKRCRLDILAISLNDLPPKYIVSNKGELYTKIEALKQQFEVDVLASLTKAAILVKERPRHEK